ncbi:similar to Saccharomyces cerevisiae YGR079W Putative protein of unknown function [Maudiozyma saulgeensis]|uniref:Uncharacterized protein n=1 Tax=Maudiozyma saulgeensis TaxID=1789683 RepID=A0A1X7QX55_9SACH|nr:similar to Saccharomyces cerevisiae YGR079W Putative protein of unknown function [Kazachstania saulgeensis]
MSGVTSKPRNGHSSNSTSFKLSNNIITKDDITPLSKSKLKSKTRIKTHNGNDTAGSKNNSNKEEREAEIVDSIPTDMKPMYSSDHSVSDDNNNDEEEDVLFSPLATQLQDDNDYSYYSDDIENLKKFQLHAPKFVNSSNHSKNDKYKYNFSNTLLQERLNSFNFDEHSLPELSNENTSHDDFWKEVTSTNEEAISLPEEENQNHYTTTLDNNDIQSHQDKIVSVEDFISDDLAATNNSSNNINNNTNVPEWNENMFQDSKHRVKLLCYRDADGKLALKTRNVPISKRNNFTTAVGLVRKRKNKHRKLLKKAIRRKSGVAQMISTDVGISELML